MVLEDDGSFLIGGFFSFRTKTCSSQMFKVIQKCIYYDPLPVKGLILLRFYIVMLFYGITEKLLE